MDITVYLPDEIGQEAKEEGLNFSGLLRAVVVEELSRRKAVEEVTTEAREIELELESRDGDAYTGRLMGRLLEQSGGGVMLYVTDDERLILYDADRLEYESCDLDDEERLAEWADPDGGALTAFDEKERIAILSRLGLRATVNL